MPARLEHPDDRFTGGRLTVDLGRLAENWRRLRDMCPTAQCAATIKADAYGAGLLPAAAALDTAGCTTFFVALPEEGRRLRAHLPNADIYILNGLSPGTAPDYARDGLRPILGSREEIDEWAGFCRQCPTSPAAALHVDTGMNRLGLTSNEARDLAADRDLVSLVDPVLILSHLACADTPAHPLNRRQLEQFQACRQWFAGVPASLANSAGLLMGPEWHFDLVRPGIAMFGGEAIATAENSQRPVMCLEGRIVQVRRLTARQTVGYGAARTAARDSLIAIVSVGYADGFHRLAGGTDTHDGAQVYINGYRAPVFGRVSMDLLAVDVTDLPAKTARRGGWVELFGDHVLVDDLARAADTIGYELLTQVGRRLSRRYLGINAGPM